MKFNEAVKYKTSGCSKCFSVTYVLPCRLDARIVDYLSNFGKPLYQLDVIKLLRIDTEDNYHIEGKIGTKNIKFTMPKELEKAEIHKIPRKQEFEKCLANWLSSVLNIQID